MTTTRGERDGEVCYDVWLTPELHNQYGQTISALRARWDEMAAASWVI
jgi:hypothetical protein